MSALTKGFETFLFDKIKGEALSFLAKKSALLGSGPIGWLAGVLIHWGLGFLFKKSITFEHQVVNHIKVFFQAHGVASNYKKMQQAINKGDKKLEKHYKDKLNSSYDRLFSSK